jgi:hypothetical protein
MDRWIDGRISCLGFFCCNFGFGLVWFGAGFGLISRTGIRYRIWYYYSDWLMEGEGWDDLHSERNTVVFSAQ